MLNQLSLFDLNPVLPPITLVQPQESVTECIVTINDIREQFSSGVEIWTAENNRCQKSGRRGRAKLAGESSSLNCWQKVAYHYALQNRERILIVDTNSHTWEIFRNGENVEFCLAYEDSGGERNYVSRDGRSKNLLNKTTGG